MKKADRERERARAFRAEVLALHQLPDHDWNDWELDWLDGELFRRPSMYEPSEKEAAVLARMRRNTTQFTGWDGYSVPELIKSAYDYRLDCDEWDQQFVERLHRHGSTTLRLREMARLVRLCRIAGVLLARFDPEREAA
jgi:hypothetical protein